MNDERAKQLELAMCGVAEAVKENTHCLQDLLYELREYREEARKDSNELACDVDPEIAGSCTRGTLGCAATHPGN